MSNDEGLPSEDQVSRLTDKTQVVGVDASDYGEDVYQYNGTYKVEYLQQVLKMVETLGWSEINLGSIVPPENDGGSQLLLFTPDCKRPWLSDQASLSVAGRMNSKFAEENNAE